MFLYSGTALPSGTPVDEAAFEIVIPEAMDIFTCDFSTLVIAGNETLATLTINLGTAYVSVCTWISYILVYL